MNKSLILILPIFILSLCSYGQSPYQLNTKQEAIILGIGAITSGTGAWLSFKTVDLTLEDLQDINSESVNSFDRVAIKYNSIQADNRSDVLLVGSHALPALLMLHEKTRKDVGKIAILYLEMYALTTGLTFTTKSIALRPRPFVYNDQVENSLKFSSHARYSFFSGHAAASAANCFFTAKVFSDYFPDSKLKPYVWGLAATIPAITGYFRVKAGKHYPSDVLIGYGVGALVGVLVPHLHKRKNANKTSAISLYPTLEGAGLTWQF